MVIPKTDASNRFARVGKLSKFIANRGMINSVNLTILLIKRKNVFLMTLNIDFVFLQNLF